MKFSPSSNPGHMSVLTKQNSEGGLVYKSDNELVEALTALPNDIDFNYFDGDFNTTLYHAALNNYINTVNYLLNERKVNPNVKVSDGLTAVHIAAHKGHTEILRLFAMQETCNLTIQDDFGETPLFRAIGNAPDNSLEESVAILLDKDNSIVGIPNEDSVYPIEIALFKPVKSNIVQLLLNNGAKVTQRAYQNAIENLYAASNDDSSFSNIFMFFPDSGDKKELLLSYKMIKASYDETRLSQETNEATGLTKQSSGANPTC